MSFEGRAKIKMKRERERVADGHKDEPKKTLQFLPTSIITILFMIILNLQYHITPLQEVYYSV